ncbi:MAG: LysR family transcriptional regulator [Hydrogenophaga sp.]|nr:LysR family transcriptional regulator [Hydrogenophaga sp.]
MDVFSDLSFFALLIRHGSLAAAAQELGVTAPAVSKRLAALERRLGVRLLQRTTRRMSLTPEGDLYLSQGARVLRDIEELEARVSSGKDTPRGLLKIGATLGFGRRYIAPALSGFARAHPEIEVQLSLQDKPFNLTEHGLDATVRFGDLPDARYSARVLAHNQRILCATPSYLAAMGTPRSPAELGKHRCLFIREGDEAFGTWHLQLGARRETVKVQGPLSSNDGEAVLHWALDGHGLMVRSLWDVAPMLRDGRLVEVLPEWTLPPADIHICFPTGALLSAKTRALVDHLLAVFAPHRKGRHGNW